MATPITTRRTNTSPVTRQHFFHSCTACAACTGGLYGLHYWMES